MKIQAVNEFQYIGKTYQNCFFYCVIEEYYDLDNSVVECFMYENQDKYNLGFTYIYSFGVSITNDIINNEILVFEELNDFFKSISPNVILELIS